MARPRLYHSKEERDEAARAKKARYYARHRERILGTMREAYSKNRGRREPDLSGSTAQAAATARTDIEASLDYIRSCTSQVAAIVGDDETAFFNQLAHAAISSNSTGPINAILESLDSILHLAEKSLASISASDGCSATYATATSLCREMSDTINNVEDITLGCRRLGLH
ncbi:hypothetical protein HGRIS_014199 [Hohenbuehelia grisea]|uniref:Uncharacterized protein n=1 Tax=Hohenbuehelia grisea TaxID=104357 RepID=A0ABR3JUD8_9AGAR